MSGSISSIGFAAPVSTETLAAAVSDASGGAVPASLITSLVSGGVGAGAAAGMSFLAANGVNFGAVAGMAPAASASGFGAAANPFAGASVSNAFASVISSSVASGVDPVPAIQSAASSMLASIILPNSGGQNLLSFLSST